MSERVIQSIQNRLLDNVAGFGLASLIVNSASGIDEDPYRR